MPAQNHHDSDQEAVLAFLGARASKRIDTHASSVFLEPDRALKIKRAVRLPFLDFSTLGRRKRACEEELVVNKRNAPHLYRRVVPITRSSRGLEIGGKGAAIEWAVEMARFDERQTLDQLAARGEITPELGEALAEVMIASHANAAQSDGASWLGSISGIADRNTEKFSTTSLLRADDVARLHSETHHQIELHRSLLRARATAGLVRRCHGDAHLGNIVLIEAKPVLFDAIEFDPTIATTDVLYDVAFPLMDLVHFGERVAANRLFNCYLGATWNDNAHALILLPLFLSLRAAIRAHVLFTKHEQSASDPGVAAEAIRYFELALRLIAPGPPSIIAIGGRSGTGKSALARTAAALVHPVPGAVVLRSDVIRKELFGVHPRTPLPEAAYAADVTSRVYQLLAERCCRIVGQGLSVALDAAFLREAERSALVAVARATDASFRGIFLDADCSVRLQRIASRRADASDATREVALLQETLDLGRLDWPKVDASGSPDETLERTRPYLPQS